MAEFLLEIYSEEIPAKQQVRIGSNFRDLFIEKSRKYGLVLQERVLPYVTPQRCVVFAENVSEKIQAIEEEIKGPSVNAPEAAIEGFCRSAGVKKNDLIRREIKGSEYFFAVKKTPAKDSKEILAKIVEEILHEFPWQKTMRWDETNVPWIRPIRNILCMLGGDVVPVKFGNLTANDKTFGHRFLAPGEIKVANPQDYFTKLEKAYVILSNKDRQEIIEEQIREAIKGKNLVREVSPILMDEVIGLVEYPKVLLGEISPEFMKLPPEILITSMATHQKYFSLKDKAGNFAPYFLVVTNNNPQDEKIVIDGNKKVLEARLADAKFFYEQDKKKHIVEFNEELKKVTFHAKLGSVYDKVQRIEKIAQYLANELAQNEKQNIVMAAQLCKADLVTQVVKEFPELQGVIGKYYAKNSDEEEIVADVIEQHYWPLGKDGRCPETMVGAIVAIADRIDTIVGLFSVGEKPTSSKDPFALRRAAIGIIKIAIAHGMDLTILLLVKKTLEIYNNQDVVLVDEVCEFIGERFKQYLLVEIQHSKGKGFNYMAVEPAFDITNPVYDTFCKVSGINEFLGKEEGQILQDYIFKRVNNILRESQFCLGEVNKDLFETDYEKNLFNKLQEMGLEKVSQSGRILDSLQQLCKEKEYYAALNKFGEISNEIKEFFDNVLVMDERQDIRNNRLLLLKSISDTIGQIADFSKIK